MWVSTLILTMLLLMDLMVIFIVGSSLSRGNGLDWNTLLIAVGLNLLGAWLWRESRK
jgi:hypothetical protein